jgi:predicted cytidylate kinase
MVIVTIGGPPGSGTSTVSMILMEITGFDYIYAGSIFREMAKERGLSLAEFGKLCENDKKVDMDLDLKMINFARSSKDMILEGRMTGPLCKRENILALKVYIDADIKLRAERVMERDGGSIDDVYMKMERREASEARRYLDYYGIDPREHHHYDIVIDSTNMTPEEEVDLIMEHLR